MALYTPAPVRSVDLTSPFYGQLDLLFRSVTLPTILAVLKDTGRFYALTWTPKTAPTPVHPFWDSDCYKSLEACCYYLMKHDDKSIREDVEAYIDIVKKAQWEDGYLSAYYTVHEPEKRFTNLRDSHELYSLGHLAEFAVAYFILTASSDLIDVCRRFIELLHKTVIRKGGYDGHQELELALIRLYEVTNEPLFLDTAEYLIRERGKNDADGRIFFDHECVARGVDPDTDFRAKGNFRFPRDYAYMQAHLPLTEHQEIDGHCVRAVYYLTGALHYGLLTPDKSQDILQATHRLFDEMVKTKMYITGGIGSVRRNEGFGPRYYLPDLQEAGACYSETCASFGTIVLCERLLREHLRAKYGDILETCLMNCVLGAVGMDGTTFYYENPLATTTSEPWHRKKWFKVACCPPNIVKTWGLLPSLQFSTRGNTVAVHLYFGANLTTTVDGAQASIKLESGFPFAGDVKITTNCNQQFDLALRIPGWTSGAYKCSAQGNEKDGYLYLQVPSGSMVIELQFPMEAKFVYAHPHTRKDQVAIVRGPLVYCAESDDNNFELETTYVSSSDAISESLQTNLAGIKDVPVLETRCKVKHGFEDQDAELYSTKPPSWEDGHKVKLIPYFLRDNRGGAGGMRVWLGRLSSLEMLSKDEDIRGKL